MKNFKKKFDFWALNNFRFSFDKREPISENEPSKCILLQTLIKIGYFQKGSFVFENSAKVDKKKKKIKDPEINFIRNFHPQNVSNGLPWLASDTIYIHSLILSARPR